jgi:hypothetical protein
MRSTRPTTLTLIGTALLAGAVVAGCGADSRDRSQSTSAAAPMAKPAEPAAGGAAEGADSGGQPPQAGKDQPAHAPDLGVDQRSIVYTGSITVRVTDVNVAAAQASGYATAAGGFIGSDNRNSGPGSDTAQLQLRVPAAKFTQVVDLLSKLGTEQTREISTEDVTEQTVDLDARIAVQQARVATGRRLLGEAKSLSDLVMLEKEVATREADLASLQAKKRRLADLTALSTITAILLDPEAVASPGDDEALGFLAGLQGGWHALLASLKVLLTVLGAVLPWLIALGLPVWAGVYLIRRLVRRRARPLTPAPATADTAQPDKSTNH